MEGWWWIFEMGFGGWLGYLRGSHSVLPEMTKFSSIIDDITRLDLKL